MSPSRPFLGKDAIAQKRGKNCWTAAESVVVEVCREHGLHVLRVQDMVCAGSNEQILTQIVSRFVVSGDGTQKGKQPTVCIGLPELFDAINA